MTTFLLTPPARGDVLPGTTPDPQRGGCRHRPTGAEETALKPPTHSEPGAAAPYPDSLKDLRGGSGSFTPQQLGPLRPRAGRHATHLPAAPPLLGDGSARLGHKMASAPQRRAGLAACVRGGGSEMAAGQRRHSPGARGLLPKARFTARVCPFLSALCNKYESRGGAVDVWGGFWCPLCFLLSFRPDKARVLPHARDRPVSSQRADSPRQGEGGLREPAGLKREGAFQRASALRVI